MGYVMANLAIGTVHSSLISVTAERKVDHGNGR